MVIELLLCGEYYKSGLNTFLIPAPVVRLLEVLFECLIVSIVDIRVVVFANRAGFVLEGFEMVVKLFHIVEVLGAELAPGVEEDDIIVPVDLAVLEMVLEVIVAVEL